MLTLRHISAYDTGLAPSTTWRPLLMHKQAEEGAGHLKALLSGLDWRVLGRTRMAHVA